jgi:hypothetical protein
MGQGFPCSAHVQRPLLPLPAVAAASASPGCCQGGLRWHSELVDQKRGSPQEFVYEGPFANAVLRVKVGLVGQVLWWHSAPACQPQQRPPVPPALTARSHEPCRGCPCSAAYAPWVPAP